MKHGNEKKERGSAEHEQDMETAGQHEERTERSRGHRQRQRHEEARKMEREREEENDATINTTMPTVIRSIERLFHHADDEWLTDEQQKLLK